MNAMQLPSPMQSKGSLSAYNSMYRNNNLETSPLMGNSRLQAADQGTSTTTITFQSRQTSSNTASVTPLQHASHRLGAVTAALPADANSIIARPSYSPTIADDKSDMRAPLSDVTG